jgi:hypothetical protein
MRGLLRGMLRSDCHGEFCVGGLVSLFIKISYVRTFIILFIFIFIHSIIFFLIHFIYLVIINYLLYYIYLLYL